MWWRLFQVTVFAAVIASDIHYGWGEGGSSLAVGVVALVAAWIATALLTILFDAIRRVHGYAQRARVRLQERRSQRRAHALAGRKRNLLRP